MFIFYFFIIWHLYEAVRVPNQNISFSKIQTFKLEAV